MLGNFKIRHDYVPNVSRADVGTALLGKYWTEQRIRFSHRYQYGVYRLASELAREGAGRTIFDIGCGPATKLNAFFGGGFELFGFDVPEAVDLCQRLHQRGTYVTADFEKPDGFGARQLPSPDVVICADVIEHLQNPDALLESIKTVATKQTWIVISTPDRETLRGAASVTPANPEHVREWSLKEFRQYLEHSGFERRKWLYARRCRLSTFLRSQNEQ